MCTNYSGSKTLDIEVLHVIQCHTPDSSVVKRGNEARKKQEAPLAVKKRNLRTIPKNLSSFTRRRHKTITTMAASHLKGPRKRQQQSKPQAMLWIGMAAALIIMSCLCMFNFEMKNGEKAGFTAKMPFLFRHGAPSCVGGRILLFLTL